MSTATGRAEEYTPGATLPESVTRAHVFTLAEAIAEAGWSTRRVQSWTPADWTRLAERAGVPPPTADQVAAVVARVEAAEADDALLIDVVERDARREERARCIKLICAECRRGDKPRSNGWHLLSPCAAWVLHEDLRARASA